LILAFIGDNSPAREEAVGEFVAGFIGIHGPTAVDKFGSDNFDLSQLGDAVSTSPFLSLRRLVVVRDLSANKDLADKLEKIIELVADTTDLVLVENRLDSRSKYLAELKKIAEVREFAHLEGDDLIRWVIAEADKNEAKISHNTALSLVDRVGTNHQLLANELKKLALYSNEITEDSVQELTTYSPKSSVFAMLDAAFAGNVSRALKLYQEQRAQGMEPQAILGMITWQLNILCIVKTAGDLAASDIATQSKISPFVIRKNQVNAKRVSEHKLVNLLDKAINIDLQMKTSAVKPDDAVQSLIMAFV